MGLLGNFIAALLDPSKENKNNLKGSIGESQAALGFFLFLDKETYTILHNITLPTPKGTTQIDHIIISRFGIFVVESKNMKGSIYGAEDQAKWTVFLGGKKFQFTNPLIQNKAHVKALSAATALPESAFHPFVFFWSDDCKFKTPMPPNVIQTGLATYIKNFQQVILSELDMQNAVLRLQSGKLTQSKETDRVHISQLKERFGTQHKDGDTCPRCDGVLKTRSAKSSGNSFLGCSNFPRCRHTEKTS